MNDTTQEQVIWTGQSSQVQNLWAFVACAVLAGIGLALTLLLPGRPRKAAHERPEPVLATRAGD